MRSFRSLFVMLALIASVPSFGQGWSRSYDTGTSWDALTWAGPAAAAGHVVAGSTDVLAGRFGDAAVLHLDERGRLLEARAHGTEEREAVAGAAPAADGAVLLCGATTVRFDYRFGFVARVARDGTLAWSRRVRAPTSTQVITLFAVTELRDGGIAVVGSFSEIDAPPRFAVVLVLEADGTERWQRTLSAGEFEQAQAVAETPSGSLLVAGMSASAGGAGDSDAWVVELSARGDLEWARTFGTSARDEATALAVRPNGGAWIAGFTDGPAASGHVPWLLRLAPDGSLEWQRVVGDLEWGDASGVHATDGGGVLVVGRLAFPGGASNDLWLAELDAGGIPRWQRAFDSGQGDWGSSVTSLPDGGLLVGAMSAWGFAEQDHWLLRLGGARDPACPSGREVDVALVEPRIESPSLPVSLVGVRFTLEDADWTTQALRVDVAVQCDACEDVGGVPPSEPSSSIPWLHVRKQPREHAVLEEVAGATALNLYVDRIGSWYEPSAASGTRCRETSWTSAGDGTLSLDVDLPAGSWLAVSTTNACGESSAGRDSFGRERRQVGTWEACPPGP